MLDGSGQVMKLDIITSWMLYIALAPKSTLMSCNSKSKELYGRLLRAPPPASAARLRQQKSYNAGGRLQRAIIRCLVPRHQHGVCARSSANSGLSNGAVIVNVDAKMQQRQIRLGQVSRYAHLRRHLVLLHMRNPYIISTPNLLLKYK